MNKLTHWLRWIWGWLSHPRKSWHYWLQSRRLILVRRTIRLRVIDGGIVDGLMIPTSAARLEDRPSK